MAVDESSFVTAMADEIRASMAESIRSLLLCLLGSDDSRDIVKGQTFLVAKGELWPHASVQIFLLNNLEAAVISVVQSIITFGAWSDTSWSIENLRLSSLSECG